MKPTNPFKSSFFSFFKAFSVTVLIVMLLEYLQLFQSMSYYHFRIKDIELLQLCAAFFLLLQIVSAILATVAALLARLQLVRHSSLETSVEILCTSILILVWIPGLLIGFKMTFPPVMRFFWLTYYGLIPALIVIFIIVMKLFFRVKFTAVFNKLLGACWKPSVLAMIASVLFFLITAAPNLLGSDEEGSSSYTTEFVEDACGGATLPNIIIIRFDALAAQDMSLYGYNLPTTPFWEEMAKFSFVFDRAHSNSNSTMPSITSLLTGKYPWSHGVYKEGDHIQPDLLEENLLALLPEYCSAAIVSTNYAYPPYVGLDNQFDYVRWSNKGYSPLITALTRFLERSSRTPVSQLSMPILRHFFYINTNKDRDNEIYAETFDRSRELLERLSGRPFFLWTHIWPPHLPYLPPDPFMKKFLPIEDDDSLMLLNPGLYKPSQQYLVDKARLRYDEFILFTDYRLKKFIRELISLDLYDDSIVIVMGDHGEGFEKRWFSHGGHLLNEPVVHVPLLIKMPRQDNGVRLKAVAGIVDVAPTILDLLNRPIPDWMDGESLVPYLKGDLAKAPITKYSMIHAEFKDMTVDLVAAYRNDYKLIYNLKTKATELYNMSEDVGESTDLKDKYPDIVRVLKNDIMEKIDRTHFDR